MSGRRGKILLALVGLTSSAFFLWLAVRNADPDRVRDALADAKLAPLFLTVVVLGVGYAFQAERWRRIELSRPKRERFLETLVRAIRWLERISRPRLRWAFGHRISNGLFGLIVLLFSVGAFLAPPFSGLDTLPALGAVLVSLGVLLEDFAIVVAGLVIGAGGVVLEFVLGKAAFNGVKQLVS